MVTEVLTICILYMLYVQIIKLIKTFWPRTDFEEKSKLVGPK